MKKLSQSKAKLREKRQQRHEVLFQRLEDRAPSTNDADLNAEWEEFREIVRGLKSVKPFGDVASLLQNRPSDTDKS